MERDGLLDILRGVGIFLVVLGHTTTGVLSPVIFLFHMPLFFFLSGAALSYAAKPGFKLVRRLRGIVAPYFFFSLISYVYWVLLETRVRPIHSGALFGGPVGGLDVRWQQFLNIFYAGSFHDGFEYNIVLWFLPSLFVALMIYAALLLAGSAGRLPGVLVCVVSGLCLREYCLPWCLEIALVAVPFVWIGDVAYRSLRRMPVWVAPLLLLAVILAVYAFQPNVEMRGHAYDPWWLFYPLVTAILALIALLGRYLGGAESGLLAWLGRNSLAVMCLHDPLKRVVLAVASRSSGLTVEALRESPVWSVVCSMAIVALLVPVIMVINRYIPAVVGRTKQS